MSKRDLAEVLVRYTGVICGFYALTKLIGFIAGLYMLISVLNDIDFSETDKVATFTTIPAISSFLVLAALAFYLLRKGDKLINFLSKDAE